MPCDDDGDFARGIELFNAGHYFESHEALERVWRRAKGSDKVAVQGLIQAAAAMLHLDRGNPRGARALYSKAQSRLAIASDEFMGVALDEFRVALREFLEATAAGNSSATRPRLRWTYRD
jgi:predicted metal-dependent hydrolase